MNNKDNFTKNMNDGINYLSNILNEILVDKSKLNLDDIYPEKDGIQFITKDELLKIIKNNNLDLERIKIIGDSNSDLDMVINEFNKNVNIKENSFLKRNHSSKIDMDVPVPDKMNNNKNLRDKINSNNNENLYDKRNAIKISKTKEESTSTDILNEVISKIVNNTLSISDLTKENLEVLVNDERSTSSTIDSFCRACGINESIFNHLCKVLNIANKKRIKSYPVDMKYISATEDLIYFVCNFEMLIHTAFKDKKLKKDLMRNVIKTCSETLDSAGILNGTSLTQTAIPFEKFCETKKHYVYGFAIFNIPLNAFIENFEKISINNDDMFLYIQQ